MRKFWFLVSAAGYRTCELQRVQCWFIMWVLQLIQESSFHHSGLFLATLRANSGCIKLASMCMEAQLANLPVSGRLSSNYKSINNDELFQRSDCVLHHKIWLLMLELSQCASKWWLGFWVLVSLVQCAHQSMVWLCCRSV